jgi:hypothetical protein
MTNYVQEAINYVQQIASQWQDITFNWHPKVLRSFDPESIAMLQSRAPLFSKHDHDYIVHTFNRGQILPLLTDCALREKVKMAVCRQGPILTLTTFAQDVLLLLLRVHGSLTSVVDKMRREHDTLRQRVRRTFEREFDSLFRSYGLTQVPNAQKKRSVERCYQHVFLHAIRAARAKGAISTRHLTKLAQREFHREYGTCIISEEEQDEEEGDIATGAPAGTISSHQSSGDIDVSKRHGSSLFNSMAATSMLYRDQIHKQHLSLSQISSAFMANHIACVFLFGSTTLEARPVSPISPVVSLYSTGGMLESSSICNEDSASLRTSNDRDSVWTVSSNAVHESNIDTASVRWRRPYIQTTTMRSEAASMVDWESSPVDVTPRSEGVKGRSQSTLSISTAHKRSSISPSTTQKRPRSRKPTLDRSSWSIQSTRVQSPDRRSQVAQHDYLESPTPGLPETRVSDADHWHGRSVARLSAVTHRSPETISVNSPSIYSLYRRSSTPQAMAARSGHGSDPLEAYVESLVHRNPFSSDGPETKHIKQYVPFRDDGSYISQSQIISLPESQIGESCDRISNLDVAPRATGSSKSTKSLNAEMPVRSRPQYILYRSSLNDSMFCRAPLDASSTERFVQSQKTIDPRSTFWYTIDGKNRKYAPTHHHLQYAITKHELETVFVDSKHLGSTEHPITYQLTKDIGTDSYVAAYTQTS